MSVQSIIEQAFRSWLKASQTPNLTDLQVILNDGGDKPPKPYLTVHVLMLDRLVNMDDEQQRSLDGSDDPQVRTKGQREATVSIQGFGQETADWMADARLDLDLPAADAIFEAANLSVMTLGGESRDNPPVDTIIEDRYLMEFEVAYALESAYQGLTEATEMEIEMTFESTPNDIDTTLTIEAA
jgi:hypothetical protein